MQTVNLPHVSIGGYGALMTDETMEQVTERFNRHYLRSEQLKRELSAELQRRELAYAEMTARLAS